MSVSKWAYKPEKCDGDFCPGDCDHCGKADEAEVEIFRCPFVDQCRVPESSLYYDDEVTETLQAPACKMPFLVFKASGSPICRLTFDPGDPDANLDKFAETMHKHVRIYTKPLFYRIRDLFRRRHDK